MHNTFNIYKIKHNKLEQLLEKLRAAGLTEQKTLQPDHYSMKFFFSENIRGNDIWWWHTYREFFNENIREPKNTFHFGLLLCSHTEKPEEIYAVSLGKSHFYLSKFIQPDFGIQLAARMADENTILLKKSRYFSGTKKQEVSSYQSFQLGDYEPGESVEHLKLKASNKETWGDRNIIFADSIQMDIDKNPTELEAVFDLINYSISEQEIIHLPKLEPIESELADELDKILFASIKEMRGNVQVDEFYVYGVSICFSFHDYDYRISCKRANKGFHRIDVGNTLDIRDISEFINNHSDITNINDIRVQFKNDDQSAFTKDLKELLDHSVTHDNYQYFLKNGEWYKFNQTFMDYLKRSLEGIDTELKDELNEVEYLEWKSEKNRRIDAGEPVDDHITYREYYFNTKQCTKNGFTLLDRQLTQIQNINSGKKKKYKLEIADLFKNGEIISVKISEDNHHLIYNIEQSKDSIELIKRGVIDFNENLTTAALWFVFEDDIQKITDFHSIQFLLAIQSWQRLIRSLNLKPKIYISKHNK